MGEYLVGVHYREGICLHWTLSDAALAVPLSGLCGHDKPRGLAIRYGGYDIWYSRDDQMAVTGGSLIHEDPGSFDRYLQQESGIACSK